MRSVQSSNGLCLSSGSSSAVSKLSQVGPSYFSSSTSSLISLHEKSNTSLPAIFVIISDLYVLLQCAFAPAGRLWESHNATTENWPWHAQTTCNGEVSFACYTYLKSIASTSDAESFSTVFCLEQFTYTLRSKICSAISYHIARLFQYPAALPTAWHCKRRNCQ